MTTRARRGRGEGGIRQRNEDGYWEGSISLGRDANGKRRRRKVYAKTKKRLLEKMDKLRSQVGARMLTDAGNQLAGPWVTWWLENVSKKERAATTWERYEELVRLHIVPALGQVKLADLTELHIEQLYSDMERAGSTTWNRKMAGMLLTNALGYAARKRLIPFNPAGEVKPKPSARDINPLTEEQAKKLLMASRPHRLHALFAVALGAGLRQGEILGLPWSAVDFERGAVTVKRSLAQTKKGLVLKEPKSQQSRRTIRLPAFVVQALREHRDRMAKDGRPVEGEEAVFVSRKGTWIRKSNLIRYVFHPLLERAGLPLIRFHDLRHTHATGLLRRGRSIKAVSRRLGHSTVELTLRVYVHVLPADDDELAAEPDALYG